MLTQDRTELVQVVSPAFSLFASSGAEALCAGPVEVLGAGRIQKHLWYARHHDGRQSWQCGEHCLLRAVDRTVVEVKQGL